MERADIWLFKKLVSKISWKLLLKVLGSISAGYFLRAPGQEISKCQKSSKWGRKHACLGLDLLLEHKQQRKEYGYWKQGKAT